MTTATMDPVTRTVLTLTVRNHPGVLSHVSSLFARRAFNLDGVICLPVAQATTSRMRLLVAADERLEQLTKQLQKLEDVLTVTRDDAAVRVFDVMMD